MSEQARKTGWLKGYFGMTLLIGCAVLFVGGLVLVFFGFRSETVLRISNRDSLSIEGGTLSFVSTFDAPKSTFSQIAPGSAVSVRTTVESESGDKNLEVTWRYSDGSGLRHNLGAFTSGHPGDTTELVIEGDSVRATHWFMRPGRAPN